MNLLTKQKSAKMIAIFNAITYANKLKDAGMQSKVADVLTEETVNMMNATTATKEDVAAIRNEMKVMELELKGFIVKSLITTVGVLGILQGILGHLLG